ncbi:MAG: hypothetical protein ABTA24_04850 [Arthrobacter sp.]
MAAAGRVDLVTAATARSDGDAEGKPATPSYVSGNEGSTRNMTITLTAFAAAVGAASSAFLALSLLVDERIETWLRRRGATRPRLVMAVIAAVTSLGMDLILDAKEARGARDEKETMESDAVTPSS